MLELLFLFGALAGIGTRAKQRRVSYGLAVGLGLLGWAVIGSVSLFFPRQTIGLLVRWAWLGTVFLSLELAHRGKRSRLSWRCDGCGSFNDGGTLLCTCGVENPDTAEETVVSS